MTTESTRHPQIRRPSPAFVLAAIALFVALGGSAWSFAKLPKNSVNSRAVKNGQIHNQDLGANAVTSNKIADNAVTGADVDESSLSLSGVSPGGPAGGELTGSYPNPSLGTVSGLDLAQSTSPTGGINFGGDTSLYRSAANVIGTDDFIDGSGPGSGLRAADNSGNTRVFPSGIFLQGLSSGNGAVSISESPGVANPYTDMARIFARDNGSGATQLVAVFPGGDVVVLATDPNP